MTTEKKVKVRTASPPADPVELFREKLAESGLDEDDAESLGLELVSAEETAAFGKNFIPCASMRFPYMDKLGLETSDIANGEPYFRVRYLGDYVKIYQQVRGENGNKKPPKYMQKSQTLPMAYFPHIGGVDWLAISEDVTAPIIITEGELKAAKATKEGFPTIGLGGVSSWRSVKHGIEMLDGLKEINWQRRYTYVVFDSDYKTNPAVCAELHKLAEYLDYLGAFVYIVTLPLVIDSHDGKVGLDDFLVKEHSANTKFMQLLRAAEPLGFASSLFELNNKYAYIDDPGIVVDTKTGRKISVDVFKGHLASPSQYMKGVLAKDGNVKYQPVKAAAEWIGWPLRRGADQMIYSPGNDKFFDRKFNTWTGWGVEPAEGDISPFIELLDHLFTDAEEGARKWFEQWLAYPLQNPGVKMFSSAVIHGVFHGTGKSLLGYTMGEIYGKNFTEIAGQDLHASFNDWAEGKQFIMGDDVTGSDKRADADFLKKLITQKELRVNVKYLPAYTVKDCINYFFTANHPDSFFLEDNDRRFFIHEVVVGPLGNEFYQRYDAWLKEGGARYVFNYLLNLDVSDFKPFAPAFMTQAKQRMIENVRSDLGSWVRQLKTNADFIMDNSLVKFPGKDLLTTQQILVMYDPDRQGRVTANGMGRELSKAGFRQVYDGRQVKLADGSYNRYYIVRNLDRWIHAGLSEIKDHLECGTKKEEKKNSKKY